MKELDQLQQRAAELAAAAWPDDRPSPELGDSLIGRLAEETGEVARPCAGMAVSVGGTRAKGQGQPARLRMSWATSSSSPLGLRTCAV